MKRAAGLLAALPLLSGCAVGVGACEALGDLDGEVDG